MTDLWIYVQGCVGIFAATIISTVLGLAGGMLTLSLLMLLLGAKVALPIHAVVLFASNFMRVIIFRKFIHWKIVLVNSSMLIPGVYLGTMAFAYLSESTLQKILGALIIFTSLNLLKETHYPSHNIRNRTPLTEWIFELSMSFLTGFIGSSVGSVGPLVTGSIMKMGLLREALIGTKAACQFALQAIKIGFFSFGSVNFEFGSYKLMTALFVASAILGTYFGKILITKIPLNYHTILTHVILIGSGLHLLLG